MKLRNKIESDNQFKAFDITLTIESEDEARLLWHVFNRGNLWDAINDGSYNLNGEYIVPESDFCDDGNYHYEIREFIETKVKIK
jgi:hypothetical protein